MKKEKEKKEEEINENNETENLDNINQEDTAEDSLDKSAENEETLEEEEEEKLKEEIRLLKEERIRVLAEMENLRKRFDREKIDSIKYGSVNFARDILSPGDNLDRALSSINHEEVHSQSIKNLIDGLLMVKKELSTALEKNGITKIESLNKKFDPNLHQAMMEIENTELEEGIVVQEIQAGYMMHDRLLRPAMVGVSKKTKKEAETKADNKLSPDNDNKIQKNWEKIYKYKYFS